MATQQTQTPTSPPLLNLLNTLQDTRDLLNFESYYFEHIKNSKLPYANSINEYITNLDAQIHTCTTDVFKMCAFPRLIELVLNKGWTCPFHSSESYSPKLERIFETGNYQFAYFSNQVTCYERAECQYYGFSLTYIECNNGQPKKFKIKYEELESNVPFSNILESIEGQFTNFTELEKWVNDNI
jgi:hypothetical protein